MFLLSGAIEPSCQRSVLVKHSPVALRGETRIFAAAIQGLLSVKTLAVGSHRFKANSDVVYDVYSEEMPILMNVNYMDFVEWWHLVCMW